MAGVNFLASQQRQAQAEAKKDMQYLLGSVVILGAVLIGWGGCFFYNQSLAGRYDDLAAEKEALQREITGLGGTQGNYLIYINKIKMITEIINERHQALDKIVAANNFLDDNYIQVRNFDYRNRERFFDSNIEAASVFWGENLFERLSDRDFRQEFQAIDYGSLSRGSQGRNSTSLRFIL